MCPVRSVTYVSGRSVIGRDTENSYPQSYPQNLLNAPRFESHGIEKLFLSRNHLVEVFVCVEVERALNPRMTHDAMPCTVFGFSFALFTNQFDKLCRRLCKPQRCPSGMTTPAFFAAGRNTKSVGLAYGLCSCHSRR